MVLDVACWMCTNAENKLVLVESLVPCEELMDGAF